MQNIGRQYDKHGNLSMGAAAAAREGLVAALSWGCIGHWCPVATQPAHQMVLHWLLSANDHIGGMPCVTAQVHSADSS